MTSRPDPELEQFKRTIDLVAYAKKAGYEPRPHDGAPGLTVLDHPNRDRIVVGRIPDGPWIYASVPGYEPRSTGEPAEQALARLRSAIDRTTDRGSIVEFVQQRDGTPRRGEVSLERVRARLRDHCELGVPLDVEGALRPPPYGGGRDGARSGQQVSPGRTVVPGGNPELNRRRYDWSPPVPNAPQETDVDQRLRRWREAQAAIDLKIRGAREVSGPPQSPAIDAVPPSAPAARGPSLPNRQAADRSESLGQKKTSELNRRRYDWTPAPPRLEAIPRGTRGRSRDRDR